MAAACLGSAKSQPGEWRTEMRFAPTLQELLEWRAGTAPVAIDIPIGVKEWGGGRDCDAEARARLPGSASTVFSPPGRYLLDVRGGPKAVQARAAECRDPADPKKVPGVSSQAAALVPRIAEVERYLRSRYGSTEIAEGSEPNFFEVHPELCFRAMPEALELQPKGSAQGLLQRLALIEHQFPDLREAIDVAPAGKKVNIIDVLDAYAALWTAQRAAGGTKLEVLGAGRRNDGLPAEIRI